MMSPFCDRSYVKPRGYAGDYGTMEVIYNNNPVGETSLQTSTDEWVLNLRSAQAVRNRRKILSDVIHETLQKWNGEEPTPVLNLASGSAREVFDLFRDGKKPNIKISCIDIDPEAHSYAAKIAAEVGAMENAIFINDNILK